MRPNHPTEALTVWTSWAVAAPMVARPEAWVAIA